MFQIPNYYKRLEIWSELRSQLEDSPTPFDDIIQFYNKAPLCSMAADPYCTDSWPDAWEQVDENIYCPFTVVLAMYYTLKLTCRFANSQFEIHIGTDKEKTSYLYYLSVDDQIIGFWDTEEPPTVVSQEVHVMN
jgi:hypothetical protein